VHEAGHVLAAWLCSHTYDIGATVVDPQGGRATYSISGHDRDASSIAWASLVIDLAGVAAEIVVFGRFRTGTVYGDLSSARVHARGIGPVEVDRLPPPYRPVLPFTLMYSPVLTDDEERVLGAAYQQAKGLVTSNAQRFYRLVALLMTFRTATEAQIGIALGSRIPVLLLRRIGLFRFL
jgi:ATP-dependent Zn protease